MPRAVVLPTLAEAEARRMSSAVGIERDEDAVYGSLDGAHGDPMAEEVAAKGNDYAERLVKYIPGEALALFLPFAAISSIPTVALCLLVAGGTAVSVIWALNRNGDLAEGLRQPQKAVVAFAGVAFLAWALGTSQSVQDLVGLDAVSSAIAMSLTAALLPAIDERIAQRSLAREREAQRPQEPAAR